MRVENPSCRTRFRGSARKTIETIEPSNLIGVRVNFVATRRIRGSGVVVRLSCSTQWTPLDFEHTNFQPTPEP